jgi:kynureninase
MNPLPSYPSSFVPDEEFARHLDAIDPLRAYRDRFLLPRQADGRPKIYFCGHSLGLQPRSVRPLLEQQLDDWANLGVEAHFHGSVPWYSYADTFRDWSTDLVGCRRDEVIYMNSLTVNLHLMLLSFYRPTRDRFRILTDTPAFPSDRYALQSQIRHHGFDPAEGLLALAPRPGEHAIRIEDIEEILEQRGPEIALVWFNGVNFFTGQVFDLARIAAAARRQGCVIGLDLAHAAGNVPLRLHDWEVDCAVWCSYKYLNGGPGAVAGCFVHEKHGHNPALPRLAGWWGNDPDTRFRMHLQPEFVPFPGADGWQISNPPILSLVPVRASLEIFNEVGMAALRAKSEALTGYLLFLLDRLSSKRLVVITPREPAQHGCQLSLLIRDQPQEFIRALPDGIVYDFREPNVIRVASVPLYNTFHEVWTFTQILAGQA